jgi:hypothetical protein
VPPERAGGAEEDEAMSDPARGIRQVSAPGRSRHAITRARLLIATPADVHTVELPAAIERSTP